MNYKFETKAIHKGQEPDKETGAIIPPIHLSSTFIQDGVGNHRGFEYSRTNNPTRSRLEEQIASLEGAKHGIAFSSGSAATSTVQLMLKSNDHIICGDDVYGGTYRFFDKVMTRFGLNYDFVDLTNAENLRIKITEKTKLLWLESPTNPLLKISDLRSLSEIASDNNIMTIVDNTFASPFLQNPLELGADLVVHSSTKYLGGHSDLVGGIVLTNNDEYAEKLRFLQNATGAIPSPFDCWLLSRGVKTLALRMRQHSENASRIAQYLSEQDPVKRVYYPFLDTHPNVDIAKGQMKMGGGMVSFDLESKHHAFEFLKNVKIFSLAESLGGVESLAEYPPEMTHGSIEPEIRKKIGINDGLVRLSVGIENIDDLLDDISHAMR
ncbi:MAG: PLP-dependent aspartate aminotransferase family protein [Candidatus Heimdallarchaeota archaeon]|nr:PLP-dependent aspartate aminotransferase family protein [Candidatus Heimdallarchaeota archaeon]MDH5645889.1 PLP-dependent aspartate aminotransferase family protein [Candidatus Heimdallarchaeota archaeon]